MRKTVMLALLSAMLFMSCGNRKEITFPDTGHLTAEKIPMSALMVPAFITLGEGKLAISAYKGDSIMHLYSIPGLKPITSFGTKGQGPNDFLIPPLFCENPMGKLIVSYYGGPFNLRSIDLDSAGRPFVKKEYKVKTGDALADMFMVNDSILVYFDAWNLTIKKYDLINEKLVGSIEINKNWDKNAGTASPDMGSVAYNDSLIIYSYDFQNRMDLYDLTKLSLKKSIVGPGEIQINRENWKETKYYYYGLYAGKKYLYALNKSTTADKNGTLQVFDYNGNPITEYTFDIFPGNPFVVDETNRYIYAYNHDYEDYFLRYKM